MKKYGMMAAAAALFCGLSNAAYALPSQIFPTVDLLDASSNVVAKLNIRRDAFVFYGGSDYDWMWTMCLDNIVEVPGVPLHQFSFGIIPSKAGGAHVDTGDPGFAVTSADNTGWAAHIWDVSAPGLDSNSDTIVDSVIGDLGDEKASHILWEFSDFQSGNLYFTFKTDLDLVTLADHVARDGSISGTNMGASPAETPEPATMALLLGGAPMLLKLRRRRQAQNEA